ncbi:hypothetical protein [Sulfuriferula plumbiphila]|uniref:hypothetical protein n=1 Tax=Sulfuriferula plumbiphila TaxID=171865 RepID=UPI0011BDFB5A|nr:hypothetical protein [Sulfuriferula plumbiphila]
MFDVKCNRRPVEDRQHWGCPLDPLVLIRQCEQSGGVRSRAHAPHLAAEPDEQQLTLPREIDTEYSRHPSYGSPR